MARAFALAFYLQKKTRASALVLVNLYSFDKYLYSFIV